MRATIIIIFSLFFFQSNSQNSDSQKAIENYLESYFKYDREIIHVQFNKNKYVNNEDIAFKGYITSKNNTILAENTTNIQLVIYDSQKQIIQKKLLFANKGTFEGGIHLDDKFKAGKYYFHFFTNWMRNFIEDDSFVQIIEIIDKKGTYNFDTNEPNWETAEITLFPEGGFIINDMINIVGVKITDCNQKGIEISDGIIVDSKSNEISRFQTNHSGNGIFYINPYINETYTLKIKSDKLNISKPLPRIQETGIIVSYNNNLNGQNLLINVKTNEKGVELYQNKKYDLLIQQNKKAILKEITFNNKQTNQLVNLDKKYLSNGVSSIRLIDENLNEITERLIYNYGTNKSVTSLEARTIANDSIILFGKTDGILANLSISVLPGDNICAGQKRAILGTFYLNTYLEKPEINNYSYYDFENKKRKEDMELLMLNQSKSKYQWNNIKSNPPKMKYTFDKGVTISGTIDKVLKPNSKYKIALFSFKDNVYEETTIDEQNKFKFENFYARDSTVFILQMMDKKNVSVFTKMTTKVSSNSSPLYLSSTFDNSNCEVLKNPNTSFAFADSKTDPSVNLNEVFVQNNFKKEILTNKDKMSMNAQGYKIEEGQQGTVLDFIARHGYRTGVDFETNDAYIRTSYNLNSSSSPVVYVDDIEQTDFNFLFNFELSEVDEIYIDKSGFSDNSSRGVGTIKVYLKKGGSSNKYFKAQYYSMIVTNGFVKNIEFKNSYFESQKEFYYFGTLNWTPTIKIKDNPNFEVKFPKGNQKEIKVQIEGFTPEGQLISEIKKISVL
ncbi:hypothetical protein [Flavobacterium myungsuense]|uniref:Carboxypeptidase regulatory-like domain-containing protein n=2 Tax=Flavobacterium myungsuense TaxID=651823 RepID=A0ABW3IXF7_9FLAO